MKATERYFHAETSCDTGFLFLFLNNAKTFNLILTELDNIENCLPNGSSKYSILSVDGFHPLQAFDAKPIKTFLSTSQLPFFLKKMRACRFIDICKLRGLKFEPWQSKKKKWLLWVIFQRSLWPPWIILLCSPGETDAIEEVNLKQNYFLNLLSERYLYTNSAIYMSFLHDHFWNQQKERMFQVYTNIYAN